MVVWLVVCAAFVAGEVDAQTAARRRALLVGINDYSASHLDPLPQATPVPGRDWPNLQGAVNDVGAMQETLVQLYGFEPADIITLTDQTATRAAILQSIDRHLLKTAAKGDVLLFYFAGHGSQVRNSLSDEADELDESLVPADSRVGARDIRDKELRHLFNQILDRGARLTVILDNCHSGSGARGLASGARPRGVRPDLRDIADGTNPGPRPEDHGALVLSAAQDFDSAWETRDERRTFHGAFSWAWMRALRDSSPGENAEETFLRTRARLRAETPFQEPVMAGNAEARLSPFLGVRQDRQGERTVVAIEKIRSDGTVMILGGWVNGLSVGTELQVVEGKSKIHLTVISLQGLARSEARIPPGRVMPQTIRPGALLEVVGWAALSGRPLRVWMPRVAGSVQVITGLARSLTAQAAKGGVHWVSDPTDDTPTHLLRRGVHEWELIGPDGAIESLGSDSAAVAAVAKIPAGSSLFVQFPAPSALIDAIAVGPGTDREGIQPADGPEETDYILVGRYVSRHLGYAWLRPSVKRSDRRNTGLPLCTKWILQDRQGETLRDAVPALREAVLRLRRIQAWHLLESPPEARSPYRLALRRERDGEWARDSAVIGEEKYGLVLRAVPTPIPAHVPQRYVYAFTIDSEGKSTLLFPISGSVENYFPLPADPTQTSAYPPKEIPLGPAGSFEITPPYGVDTYFLLSTDEPLSNPWILEWDGVRARQPQALTPLEQLLMLTGSTSRATPIVTPANWSIEKVVYESVPPRKPPKKHRRSRH